MLIWSDIISMAQILSNQWILKRRPYWDRLAALLAQCDASGLHQLSRAELQEIALLYRQVAADRSVLRQDPNIVLVGEIRDSETAHVAVQAALTGHLLLSTLHTTDAPEVLLRLMEIGVEYFYVREVVKLIIAQRLVRELCPNCKTDYEPTPGEAALKTSAGCTSCRNTGFIGRTGVYEVMPMSPAIKEMMAPDIPLIKVRQGAIEEGMRTLWQNAVEKVLAGQTSLEEIRRAVPQA